MKLGKKKSNRAIPVVNAEAQKDIDPDAQLNNGTNKDAKHAIHRVNTEEI